MWDTYIKKVYGLDFSRHPLVYGPEEDTVLLLEHISSFNHSTLPQGPVAEACCGHALAGIYMAREWGRTAIVSDINPHALLSAVGNAALNETQLHPVRTRGLSALRDDSLVFVACNPPYLPGQDDSDWETRALDGGPSGVDTAIEIMKEANRCLMNGGVAMFLLSSLGNLKRFEEAAKEVGFSVKRSAPRPVGDFERLYVYTMRL